MRVFIAATLAVCLVTLVASRAQAQPATNPPLQLTLDEAIVQALERNRDLAVSRRDIDIGRGKLTQARRYPFNPELVVEGEGGRGVGREDGERRGVGGGKVGVAQVVEIRGQRSLRVRAAEAEVARAQWAARDAERGVIAETTKAFSDLLLAQERLLLSRESLTLATDLRTTARTLTEAGDVPELDVLRADVEVRRASNRVRLDEAALTSASRALALLIGGSPDASLEARGPLLLDPVPGGLDQLLASARSDRPDVKAAEAALETATWSLRLVRADRFLPSVTLSASYGESLDFDSRNRLALFGISVPLPFWNRREGDLQAAEAEVAKQQAERERVIARLDKEVRTAAEQFAAARRVAEEYVRQILPGQEQNARLIREGYRLGQFRLTDALLAQRDLIDTRTAYLDAIAAYNLLRVELQKAVGGRP